MYPIVIHKHTIVKNGFQKSGIGINASEPSFKLLCGIRNLGFMVIRKTGIVGSSLVETTGRVEWVIGKCFYHLLEGKKVGYGQVILGWISLKVGEGV